MFQYIEDASLERLESYLRRWPGAVDIPVGRWMPLHVAVARGDIEAVNLLLRHGTDPNRRFFLQKAPSVRTITWTALHEAARLGNAEVTRVLLLNGAKVNTRAQYGLTPLHVAVWHCHDNVVRELIHAGCDVDAEDEYQERSLSLAIYNGSETCVELLLAGGATLNTPCWSTRTPGGLVFHSLLCYGVRGWPEQTDPVSLARFHDWPHIVRQLVIHGASTERDAHQLESYCLLYFVYRPKTEFEDLMLTFLESGHRFSKKFLNMVLGMQSALMHNGLGPMIERISSPLTLQELSRKSIRNQMQTLTDQSILRRVHQLPLPKFLRNYVALNHCKSANKRSIAASADPDCECCYFSLE